MALDIVIVPDFACKKAHTFQWQTFYLLASIAEYANLSPSSVVYINCIGTPPAWLHNFKQYFNLQIKEKPPSAVGGFHNKLQGLVQYSPSNNSILLLDSDILMLKPLEKEIFKLGKPLAAAAIANEHHLPNEIWTDLYASHDYPVPDQRKPFKTLNEKLKFKKSEFKDVRYPYFNGGIVFFDSKIQLDALWKKHIEHYHDFIHSYPEEMLTGRMKASNQPSLATLLKNVESEHGDGSTALLTDTLHSRWQHIAARDLKVSDITLLHMIGVLKNINENDSAKVIHSKMLGFCEWQIKNLHKQVHSRINFSAKIDAIRQINHLKVKLNLLFDKYFHNMESKRIAS